MIHHFAVLINGKDYSVAIEDSWRFITVRVEMRSEGRVLFVKALDATPKPMVIEDFEPHDADAESAEEWQESDRQRDERDAENNK